MIHIFGFFMVLIMLYHIRTKYTAVGRREISLFFYLYIVIEVLDIFLDSAVIPTYSSGYIWLVGVHIGLVLAMAWCLMANGFVGFQFWEDGTRQSLCSLYGTTALLWLVGFLVSSATFKGWAEGSLDPQHHVGLYVVHMILPVIFIAIWLITQVWLVLRTLDTLWPLGDLFFATLFYVAGLVLMMGVSIDLCEGTKHYVDGLFFGTLAILFAIMMVYKFWDDITREDLEFSVGARLAAWEVKDPAMFGSETASFGSKPNLALPGNRPPQYTKAGYQPF